MIRTIATTAFAALALATPATLATALAEDRLNTKIVSPVPEAQEDCEALRDKLASLRDDNILTPRDHRELRDKGC